MKEYPIVLPNDYGIRPAGKLDECFYCRAKVGEPHKKDCVVIVKRVKMRFTIEVETEEPCSWSKKDIEFRYNESSWCVNNLVPMLQKEIRYSGNCLCHHHHFNARLVKVMDNMPIRAKD